MPRRSHVALATIALVACGPSEADRARDRTGVERVLAKDMAASGQLRQVDAALGAGDRVGAITTLEKKAMPAADEAVTAARAFHPTTPWGKARASDLASLTADRRRSMDDYAKALGGDDGNALLATIEAQKIIEKRALALWQSVEAKDP